MSLKKVADMAGVSVSIVSRVLNNKDYGCASESVKQRIWECAREINYIPNENAKRLRQGKMGADSRQAKRIAVILARFSSLEEDPFFGEVYRSVEQELFVHGCNVGWLLGAEGYLKDGCAGADGFIVLGRSSPKLLSRLEKSSRNLVSINRNPTDYAIDEVVCNGKEAAEKAMDYLIGKGHKRIAYIGDCSYETRYIGYCDSLIRHKLPMDYSYIYPTDQTRDAGYEAMKQLMAQDSVDAVLCANDATAIGALGACAKVRKAQGGYMAGIDVISIDDTREAGQTEPLLTTIHVPGEEMGKAAVKMLVDRMNRGHAEKMRIEFPSRLVRRESC